MPKNATPSFSRPRRTTLALQLFAPDAIPPSLPLVPCPEECVVVDQTASDGTRFQAVAPRNPSECYLRLSVSRGPERVTWTARGSELQQFLASLVCAGALAGVA